MSTTKKSKPAKPAHYVELEHERGFERFHCPVCGKAVLKPGEGFTEKPCKHVVLIQDWIGEFYARDEDVDALIEKTNEEADEKDGYTIELLRKKFGQNVIFFELLESRWGPKDAEVATVVVDMAMASARPEE